MGMSNNKFNAETIPGTVAAAPAQAFSYKTYLLLSCPFVKKKIKIAQKSQHPLCKRMRKFATAMASGSGRYQCCCYFFLPVGGYCLFFDA